MSATVTCVLHGQARAMRQISEDVLTHTCAAVTQTRGISRTDMQMGLLLSITVESPARWSRRRVKQVWRGQSVGLSAQPSWRCASVPTQNVGCLVWLLVDRGRCGLWAHGLLEGDSNVLAALHTPCRGASGGTTGTKGHSWRYARRPSHG